MVTYTTPQLQSLSDYYSGVHSVPPGLTRAVIGAESSWNPSARNPVSDALGLGQILSSTAARPGYGVTPVTDRTDVTQSLNFVPQYLRALYDRFGSWTAALQRYSGQMGTPYANNPAVQQALADVGETPLGVTGGYAQQASFTPVSWWDTLRQGFGGSPGAWQGPQMQQQAESPAGRAVNDWLASWGINGAGLVIGILMLGLGAYFLVKRGM